MATGETNTDAKFGIILTILDVDVELHKGDSDTEYSLLLFYGW